MSSPFSSSFILSLVPSFTKFYTYCGSQVDSILAGTAGNKSTMASCGPATSHAIVKKTVTIRSAEALVSPTQPEIDILNHMISGLERII